MAAKQKEFMTIEPRKLMISFFKEKPSLWSFANGAISVLPAENVFGNTILFLLPITAKLGEWHFTLYLSFDRYFLSSRFHSLLVFLSQRSEGFWIPSIMQYQTNSLRLFPLINLKAMPLLVNVSVSSLIPRNTVFCISCQIALKIIWLIIGEAFRERKG
jgi:hypothetical protein